MKKENKKLAIAPFLALIITQLFLHIINVNNIPANLLLTIIIIFDTVLIIVAYVYRNEGLGPKFNIILSILCTILTLTAGIGFVIDKYYNQQFKKYGLIIILALYVCFIALAIFIFASLIYHKNKTNKY